MENGRCWRRFASAQNGNDIAVNATSDEMTIRKRKEVRLVIALRLIETNTTDFAEAFAEIDWHDYAIVQTIDFTAADYQAELPPPMSVAEVENMTLAQKKMAAMIMENTAPEVEAIRAAQAEADAKAAAEAEANAQMDVETADDAERRVETERQEMEETERAKGVTALNTATMKIRKDYVPKSKRPLPPTRCWNQVDLPSAIALAAKNAGKAAVTTCNICHQSILVAEFDEHRRIELLDPRWKTLRDSMETRRATANEQQLGANVVTSLKQLARVFGDDQSDEANLKQIEAENEIRRKEREKIAWDGFTATKEGTVNKFQSNVNFDEQIASIWKAKGLAGADPATQAAGIGPNMGPTTVTPAPPPPVLPASLPPNPLINPATGQAYASASVASGPQPATVQFGGFGGMPQNFNPAFGASGPMAGMHPSRMAQLGEGPPGVAGYVRSADEMMEGGGGAIQPAPKRPKIAKLPDGRYYAVSVRSARYEFQS